MIGVGERRGEAITEFLLVRGGVQGRLPSFSVKLSSSWSWRQGLASETFERDWEGEGRGPVPVWQEKEWEKKY